MVPITSNQSQQLLLLPLLQPPQSCRSMSQPNSPNVKSLCQAPPRCTVTVMSKFRSNSTGKLQSHKRKESDTEIRVSSTPPTNKQSPHGDKVSAFHSYSHQSSPSTPSTPTTPISCSATVSPMTPRNRSHTHFSPLIITKLATTGGNLSANYSVHSPASIPSHSHTVSANHQDVRSIMRVLSAGHIGVHPVSQLIPLPANYSNTVSRTNERLPGSSIPVAPYNCDLSTVILFTPAQGSAITRVQPPSFVNPTLSFPPGGIVAPSFTLPTPGFGPNNNV